MFLFSVFSSHNLHWCHLKAIWHKSLLKTTKTSMFIHAVSSTAVNSRFMNTERDLTGDLQTLKVKVPFLGKSVLLMMDNQVHISAAAQLLSGFNSNCIKFPVSQALENSNSVWVKKGLHTGSRVWHICVLRCKMSFYTTSDADSTYHALMIGELPNPSKNTKQKTSIQYWFTSRFIEIQAGPRWQKLPVVCQAIVPNPILTTRKKNHFNPINVIAFSSSLQTHVLYTCVDACLSQKRLWLVERGYCGRWF